MFSSSPRRKGRASSRTVDRFGDGDGDEPIFFLSCCVLWKRDRMADQVLTISARFNRRSQPVRDPISARSRPDLSKFSSRPPLVRGPFNPIGG
ncbi:hypothetical protein F2Q70_00036926 [Brassica cretica]|uniref:Uncharacterized protein n=1 Tax=Brassica cretica TaxID=69181 RepID=A0A8S9K152_BRACR|nr:hypothetical protein F2Q70_00036926 [Brassica cretica]